jgi:hemolysin III
VSHQWACLVSIGLGIALVISAPPGRATFAALVYALSVVTLFATSATYHRVNWRRPNARRWMRRLDHSAIFLLIAGSYTPFALLALDGTLADVTLVIVWSGALGGILLKILWIDAPNWVVALIYVGLGWVAVPAAPGMVSAIGITASSMVGVGGVLYTIGAVVYVSRRPDPVPTGFGYHEVFHVLVIVAAALQYAVIAFGVLPGA